jgi:hypothetical protein
MEAGDTPAAAWEARLPAWLRAQGWTVAVVFAGSYLTGERAFGALLRHRDGVSAACPEYGGFGVTAAEAVEAALAALVTAQLRRR